MSEPDTSDFIRVDSAVRPCWHCGKPTPWIEINFETNLCPGACNDAKTAEWWEADRRAGPWHA